MSGHSSCEGRKNERKEERKKGRKEGRKRNGQESSKAATTMVEAGTAIGGKQQPALNSVDWLLTVGLWIRS